MLEKTAKGVGAFVSILAKPYQLAVVVFGGAWILALIGLYMSELSILTKILAITLVAPLGVAIILRLSFLSQKEEEKISTKNLENQAEVGSKSKQKEMELNQKFEMEKAKNQLEHSELEAARTKAFEMLYNPPNIPEFYMEFGENVTLEIKTVGSLRFVYIKQNKKTISKFRIP